jgi:hypothetical protein
MPIPLPEIIQTPAIPQKSFDILWIYNLAINCPTTTRGTVRISCLPMSSTTGELADLSLMQNIHTSRLFEAVQAVPEVAAAFQAVIDAIVPLQEWIASTNSPQEP